MNIGAVLLAVVALVLGDCSQPLAGPQSVERPALSTPSAAPSQAEGTTTREQVVPEKGELPPGPEPTPEERKRLIRGTEIEAPPAPCSDVNRPSQPAR